MNEWLFCLVVGRFAHSLTAERLNHLFKIYKILGKSRGRPLPSTPGMRAVGDALLLSRPAGVSREGCHGDGRNRVGCMGVAEPAWKPTQFPHGTRPVFAKNSAILHGGHCAGSSGAPPKRRLHNAPSRARRTGSFFMDELPAGFDAQTSFHFPPRRFRNGKQALPSSTRNTPLGKLSALGSPANLNIPIKDFIGRPETVLRIESVRFRQRFNTTYLDVLQTVTHNY